MDLAHCKSLSSLVIMTLCVRSENLVNAGFTDTVKFLKLLSEGTSPEHRNPVMGLPSTGSQPAPPQHFCQGHACFMTTEG